MYITIEKAVELAEASKSMKSGTDPQIHFLRVAIDELVKSLEADVDALMVIDNLTIKSEREQGRLPKWYVELTDYREPSPRNYYSRYDFGLSVGNVESARRLQHINAHILQPVIKEAREKLGEISSHIYPQSIIDQVEGFRARVADAVLIKRTNFNIEKSLYETLTRGYN